MKNAGHRSIGAAVLIGIIVTACSPTPSPAPTSVSTPSTDPVPSPTLAALACDDAAEELFLARAVLLADFVVPTGIDPIAVSEIPEHAGVAARVLRDHESCFSTETLGAWREAIATVNNPPADGIRVDELRELFENLPTEPLE